MKTIKQIAKEIGVSKQAIFYRISKPPLSKSLKQYISKSNGVLTVSFDGENLIKSAFSNDRQNATAKEQSKENSSFDDESLIKSEFEENQADSKYIKLLEKNNFNLHEELKTKNKQIEILLDIINNSPKSGNKWTKTPRAWSNNNNRVSPPIERLIEYQFDRLDTTPEVNPEL